MSVELWIALLAGALGTYLIRLLPLLWMQRRLRHSRERAGTESMPAWLGVLGPMMIAAVLGVSLVPRVPDATGWIATLVGLAATLLTWRRTRSLGLPVIVGVATFGVMTLVRPMLG
ncbi:AzlD domain-containing protein [Salinicola endophyticus]|uniref:AzlD domain-containing protein n=1 Tax=Salinicola endophyticus TaxID=1949083 RepID=A0ABY8FBI2_9GAMM|nr:MULTISPECIES: AzlD domain-containing protein [Salinicola]WFF40115.1 AzlD domain-containing protein [Salinicola endophyticus]